MKYCIHIIIEQFRHISRGSAESYLTTRVLQKNDCDIKSFDSREEAEDYLKEEIYGDIYGYDVKGYEIREFILFGEENEE